MKFIQSLSAGLSICIVISAVNLFAGENPRVKPYGKAITECGNHEIDKMLREVSAKNLTITERIKRYSGLFLGMPYSWTATGDGPYALYENYPLVSFDSTNCMVYCEHVLAMAISDNWDHFFNNLQQIRYKDGIIGMQTRNHYTMADWLPENDWILDDVSRIVGGKFTKTMTRTISHEKFFKGKGVTDLRRIKPDRKITIDYVPLDKLDKVENQCQNADIVALLIANKDDIFSAHMLMIVELNGKKYFREASNSLNTTFETPYQEWVRQTQKKKRYAGMAFMRVKTDLNQAGKIIYPEEIPHLKEKKD
ncbi:MAG TPA: DUF1460 domain-containing protein [Candidatus Marinimicrobia bacterium]|nr:DUF1460 domain-containing protein [Candidatus Neomarinimicrobiota bacterium]